MSWNWKQLGLLSVSLVFFTLSLIVLPTVQAQNSFDTSYGVATYLPVTDKNAKDGSIISSGEKGFEASNIEYDPTVVGVVSERPAVVFNTTDDKKFPVLSSGNVYVLISGENGPIKKGSLITTSKTPGVGVKALKSGFVIGSALQDFAPSNPKEIRKILISLNIYYSYKQSALSNNFFSIIQLSTIASAEQPVVVLKYSLGGLLLIISFVIAFATFAKSSQRGIEAIGRNPLAARMIQLSILLNVIISIAIVLAGFGLAYVVVKF